MPIQKVIMEEQNLSAKGQYLEWTESTNIILDPGTV